MAESRNPYAPPAADHIDRDLQSGASYAPAQFYVVSMPKFYLLACTTFGLYKSYWFYAQFRAQQRSGDAMLAAFFSFFTAHGLFRQIDGLARAAGLPSSPRATNQTAPYIVLTLLIGIVRGLSKHSLALSVVALGISALSAVPLARVQGIVNRTAGDARGAQNSKFSALNVVSVSVGVLIMALGFVRQALVLR
jgi:hypothetical protein